MNPNRLKLITNKCPACGETMIPDKYDYYICTGCGGQFGIPSESKREVKRLIKEAIDNCSHPIIKPKSKKSSSKSGKRASSKKASLQRPSTTALYNKLAAQSNKIILKKV